MGSMAGPRSNPRDIVRSEKGHKIIQSLAKLRVSLVGFRQFDVCFSPLFGIHLDDIVERRGLG